MAIRTAIAIILRGVDRMISKARVFLEYVSIIFAYIPHTKTAGTACRGESDSFSMRAQSMPSFVDEATSTYDSPLALFFRSKIDVKE